jgi:hypothetical protein
MSDEERELEFVEPVLPPEYLYLDFDLFKAIFGRDWYAEALCRQEVTINSPAAERKAHVDKFYPEQATHGGGHLIPARQICLQCPVRMECLQDGLYEPSGVWGGHSPTQRKRIARMVKSGSSLLEASQFIDQRSKDAR